MMDWQLFFTVAAAFFSLANFLGLGYVVFRLWDMEDGAGLPSFERSENNNTADGMDLMLLKPKRQGRRARRFTDKSREWMTARETASRR